MPSNKSFGKNVLSGTYNLWMLYKAGQIGYKMYRQLLGKPKAEQKKFINAYKNKTKTSLVVKKAPKRVGSVRELSKKVKKIQKTLNTDLAIHVRRERNTFLRSASVNSQSIDNYSTFTITVLESAMANIRYFDPGTNALVTADPASGNYFRHVTVKGLYATLTGANNYQIPCKLTIYACVPRKDTNNNPVTFFTSGLTDQAGPSNTSPLVHLTDSLQFMENWKIDKSISKVLQPGQSLSLSWSCKPFEYDIATSDVHNLSFQKKFGGMTFVTRVEGVLAHDNTLGEYGFTQSAVDCVVDRKFVFEYDSAGKDLHDISISDNSDTFTNAGVVSNKPVSDNQSYSVA